MLNGQPILPVKELFSVVLMYSSFLNNVVFYYAIFERHPKDELLQLEQILIEVFNPQLCKINAIAPRVINQSTIKGTFTEETILNPSTTLNTPTIKLIEIDETRQIEFKETFSVNTSTGKKKDDEIRRTALSVMCGFLNTNNGVLLIGVRDKKNCTDDDSEIPGIENDGFLGDKDKYCRQMNDLIREVFGVREARLISVGIEKIGDKHICRIECQKSKTPVYLKYKGREEAFVRDGTSTIVPNQKEWLEWCKENF